MAKRKIEILAMCCSFLVAALASAGARIGTVIISPLSNNTGSENSLSVAAARLHENLMGQSMAEQAVTEQTIKGITIFCSPMDYSAKKHSSKDASASYQLHYCLSSELPDETAQQIHDSFAADEIDTAAIVNSETPPGLFNTLALWLSELANVLGLFFQSTPGSIEAISLDLEQYTDAPGYLASYSPGLILRTRILHAQMQHHFT